ncbi:MAG: metallophosphoesterase [Bacteroidia bacterium]
MKFSNPIYPMVFQLLMRLAFTLGFFILIDFYVQHAFFQVLGNKPAVKWGFWSVNIFMYLGLASVMAVYVFDRGSVPRNLGYWFGSFMLVLYVPKMLMGAGLLLEDVFRLGTWITNKVGSPEEPYPLGRRKFISQGVMALAAIPFAGMIYGIVKGRYAFKIRKVQVPVQGLPAAFNGFTITQLSDIHIGSFDDKEAVGNALQKVKELNSDIVCFTGDLVNTYAEEFDGWDETFKTLTAAGPVYTILGNHDYGDYAGWDSPAEKQAHFERMVGTHKRMGWDLLRDEHRWIERDGERIALVGVENWGESGFKRYGNLDNALKGTEDAPVRVLLSHDPSHWNAQTVPNKHQVDLTLSGHTHGMQFGVEIPKLGIKFSPVQWRYPQWAGLYNDGGNQHLYVNRGFGHIGYMGRAGIMPEITVLELVKA